MQQLEQEHAQEAENKDTKETVNTFPLRYIFVDMKLHRTHVSFKTAILPHLELGMLRHIPYFCSDVLRNLANPVLFTSQVTGDHRSYIVSLGTLRKSRSSLQVEALNELHKAGEMRLIPIDSKRRCILKALLDHFKNTFDHVRAI